LVCSDYLNFTHREIRCLVSSQRTLTDIANRSALTWSQRARARALDSSIVGSSDERRYPDCWKCTIRSVKGISFTLCLTLGASLFNKLSRGVTRLNRKLNGIDSSIETSRALSLFSLSFPFRHLSVYFPLTNSNLIL
jgi:hypothetical protein